MLRRRRFYVIYPEYFNKDLSRSEGRRVPKNIAAEDPNLKKLKIACDKIQKKYNFEYQLQPDKAHPSRYWEKNGRVLISIDKKNKIPKSKIVYDLADLVRRIVKKKSAYQKKKKGGIQRGRTPSAKRKRKPTGSKSKKSTD